VIGGEAAFVKLKYSLGRGRGRGRDRDRDRDRGRGRGRGEVTMRLRRSLLLFPNQTLQSQFFSTEFPGMPIGQSYYKVASRGLG
jgi:hypothetical protein